MNDQTSKTNEGSTAPADPVIPGEAVAPIEPAATVGEEMPVERLYRLCGLQVEEMVPDHLFNKEGVLVENRFRTIMVRNTTVKLDVAISAACDLIESLLDPQ